MKLQIIDNEFELNDNICKIDDKNVCIGNYWLHF